jgi:uncharacterized protein YlaN (UPF0358 family)
MTNYQKHLVNIIIGATAIEYDELPIADLEEKVKAVAKSAPAIVANYLDKLFHRAADAWSRGNNSGSAETMTRCDKQCDQLRREAEQVLQLWGVKVDYPGLYPCFEWNERHYTCDLIGLMRDISTYKSYAQKAVETIRELPQAGEGILLWEFPAVDFSAWRAMPDTPALKSYGEYLAVVAAVQADVEQKGKIVVRVKLPVADVIAELTRQGLENNNQNRAKVLGLLASKQGSQA